MLLLKVKERGQQLALGQIAGRAEDHNNAWIWNPLFLQTAVKHLAVVQRLSHVVNYHGRHIALSFLCAAPVGARADDAYFSSPGAFFTACPPNSLRITASMRSVKLFSSRERRRRIN